MAILGTDGDAPATGGEGGDGAGGEDGKGFRKKLKPQFDGTYDTSKDVESLSTATTNGSILLRYSTPLSEWEEKLVQLDSLSFSVVNDEGVTYRYNRFEPIKIQQ